MVYLPCASDAWPTATCALGLSVLRLPILNNNNKKGRRRRKEDLYDYFLWRACITVNYTLHIMRLPERGSPLTDMVVGHTGGAGWGGGRGEGGQLTDDSADSRPVFSTGRHCEQFWHGQGCQLFDFVHPAFPLPITTSPTLQ